MNRPWCKGTFLCFSLSVRQVCSLWCAWLCWCSASLNPFWWSSCCTTARRRSKKCRCRPVCWTSTAPVRLQASLRALSPPPKPWNTSTWTKVRKSQDTFLLSLFAAKCVHKTNFVTDFFVIFFANVYVTANQTFWTSFITKSHFFFTIKYFLQSFIVLPMLIFTFRLWAGVVTRGRVPVPDWDTELFLGTWVAPAGADLPSLSFVPGGHWSLGSGRLAGPVLKAGLSAFPFLPVGSGSVRWYSAAAVDKLELRIKQGQPTDFFFLKI